MAQGAEKLRAVHGLRVDPEPFMEKFLLASLEQSLYGVVGQAL